MIVLHAVVPRDVGDVSDLRLLSQDAGPVTVLYEETDEPPTRDREAMLEHGRRVTALTDRTPLLPIRYGTTLPGVDDLRVLAEERADAWSRRLVELTGRCELVVHVEPVAAEEAAGADESGRDYLRRRMGLLHRQDRAIADVRAVIAPWSEDVRLLPDRTRLAVLVRRRDAADMSEALNAWAKVEDAHEVQIAVTGPWPPFSFCEEEDLS